MRQYSVLISHYRPDIVSGAERAVADMVSSFSDAINVQMFVPGPGKLADFYQRKKLKTWVRSISTPRRLFPGLHTIQSIQLALAFRKTGINGVVCNTFSAASRVSTASRMAKLPYAVYVREYVRDIELHRRVLQAANEVFAVSNDVGKYITPMVNGHPVHVVHDNILPAPIIERIQKSKHLAEHRFPFDDISSVVGWVGRITSYKQPEIFIRAIPLVLKQLPDTKFVLIGDAQKNEKGLEDNLKQLVNDLGINQNVFFMGQREDVIELMSEMAIFCLTSRREPFARVILEAQMAGCPVIAPMSGGAPEAVQDGITGLLFDSCGQDAHFQLAQQIIYLLSNPDIALKFAAESKKFLTNGYASDQPVRVFEQRITELIEKGVRKYG